MGKTTEALVRQLNGSIQRLDAHMNDETMPLRDRDIMSALNALAIGQHTIAQHMDEDRDNLKRFQSRMFAFASGILGSVMSGVILLIIRVV